jgi:hypothetical protein
MSRGHPIDDTQLQFSAELAAAVGLEEAVLVQQLKTVYRHQPAAQRDGLRWLHVSHAYLLDLLPFWDLPTLLRVCDSLATLGLLRVDRDRSARDCLLLALEEGLPVPAPVPAPRQAPEPVAHPPAAAAGTTRRDAAGPRPRRGEGEPLPPDFAPSEDMLELLERFHGVPRAFALAQLEDFTLYWRERGSAGHAWQNRFKQHVQWHWRKQQEQTGGSHGGEHEAGGTRRTRDSSLEHDLTDTSWAE